MLIKSGIDFKDFSMTWTHFHEAGHPLFPAFQKYFPFSQCNRRITMYLPSKSDYLSFSSSWIFFSKHDFFYWISITIIIIIIISYIIIYIIDYIIYLFIIMYIII